MSGPTRVLHVVRPAAGGIRKHVLALLAGLDPILVTSSVAAPPEFIRGIPNQNGLHAAIPLEIAAKFAPISDLRQARRLTEILPQFADIVHAHGVRAAWVAALAHRRRPFPLIFTAHNQVERTLTACLVLSFISRHCSQIIAVSESAAASLVACDVPPAKIQVVPNGVDTSYFSRVLLPRTESRAALALPQAAFVIASAARFSPEKGLDILIEAARSRRNMTFLIAGDGPLFGTLSTNLPSNVQLLGQIEDIRPLLAAADIFAVPSRREGQGIAALEAMAARLPVIASRIGGLAEMLTDGETALLVPPNDPSALAAALGHLHSDSRLRKNLAESAERLVQSRYRVETMLNSLTDVYREIST